MTAPWIRWRRIPADRVELAVEIVSTDRNSYHHKKQLWYARSGIPVYLLIDPNVGVCELCTEPVSPSYRAVRHSEFGEPVKLPEPFGFSVETSRFRRHPPRP
ncbi:MULTISPECIES: Uma2 family endonuclease [unclassified Streptomyces]|uniref:Uma2 family endonuclease n=1 Tax=unclassified Streptomyces TaxID=2593676 RepID=UPI0022B74B76|nr:MULTISPECIES: Uma2 family endonuclease [unclassified Streptomyces]MCZ7416492.1 Uma2 family endonuclease [Streptomyces sp. WMMC897]MCZ7433697.1 Uma2 family endonuclease [Streptomyces sp. WMMC1477]